MVFERGGDIDALAAAWRDAILETQSGAKSFFVGEVNYPIPGLASVKTLTNFSKCRIMTT